MFVEHIIRNVLIQSLGGIKIANRWLDKLYSHGYVTILDVIDLTPEKLEELDFPIGDCDLWRIFKNYSDCDLWRIFKNYTQEKAELMGYPEIFDAPDDLWMQLSAEDFKAFRIHYLKSSHDTTLHSQSKLRERNIRSSFASSTSTPIQQNITQ